MTQELEPQHVLDVDDHVLQRLQRVSNAFVLGKAANLEQPASALEALLGSLFAGDVNTEAPRRRPRIHVRLNHWQELLDDYSQRVAGSLAMAVEGERTSRNQISDRPFSKKYSISRGRLQP